MESTRRVLPGALEPNYKTDHKTSVFRTLGLTEPGIWDLGDRYLGIPTTVPVIARGEVTVADIESVGLGIDADDSPPRHVNITGWPQAKHECKDLAKKLAAKAKLVVR